MNTADHTQRAHAKKYSPSKADCWLTCTAQPAYVARLGIPDSRSAAANEGTAAHMLLDTALTGGKHPISYKGKQFNGYEATPEMVHAVGLVWEWVQAYVLDGWELYNETKVTIAITGDVGTMDIGLRRGRSLIIADLKYGKGVAVSPVKNRQGRLYALGFLDHYKLWGKIDNVSIAIAQPRVDEEVQVWEDSIAGLTFFRDEAARRIAAIEAGDVAFIASEKGCKWCPAKGQCKTYGAWSVENAGIEFDTLTARGEVQSPDCQSLTSEELVNCWRAGQQLKQWIKAVSERIFTRLVAGDDTLGLKLVEGKSKRKWANEGDTMDALVKMGFVADDFAPRKMGNLSTIQALFDQKTARDAFMKAYTVKPPGKATIAGEDDPRPAAQLASMSEFPDDEEVEL